MSCPRLVVSVFLLVFSAVCWSQISVDLVAGEQSSSQSSSAPSECSGDGCENEESNSSKPPIDLKVEGMVDVDKLASSWETQVSAWMSELGFTAGWSAKAAATAITVFVALLLMWLIANGSKKAYRKIVSIDKKLKFNKKRLKIYRNIVSTVLQVITVLLVTLTILVIWFGAGADLSVAEKVTNWLASSVHFAMALVILVVLFEVISALIESYFIRVSARGSARLDTVMPIVRSIVYGIMLLLFAITLISQLGINVTPILASAGVFGIAIGFAAQALIKDVLNGFIILMEDLLGIGDVVTVGERTGIVEKITLRKIQLRDLDGCVYTVPCNEISVVKNFTKIFSYYLFDIGVAYRESTDEVCEILHQISKEMMEDEQYSDDILEPLEILGVDSFADSAVMIKARIKTKPIRQWKVGREFNRRMKYAFDKHNIEIPFPHQTLYFGESKNGEAPAAKVLVNRELENADHKSESAPTH
ncbi:mechanosensitive ion channel family protein [Gilvimarinus sp. SDUM040013]|uniref:Mechanosensitive ion channel family protein n=1 Tax=Gilvimarinus gilvus TaxID=3058038 RepID=A0ABU4RUR9_9GAMM|nr:mechanosensitive ion channel family protein [Gilvimarinus sp. SDUM040013]MDO3388504.1 mechanosensitive ion channel family protein [Gilvimarinus sp. SDUM040013]MDX6848624.1 mechanosensitive ion channel family protein [Gilvimarinus sp. SDUM040013]